MGNADIPQSTKYPILLNQSHHVTLLIVCECHEIIKHGGVKETLAELCSRFRIIKGRNFVRKALHRCVICWRFNGTPFAPPLPPPLPSFRVSETPPFTYTGVDFAGLLYIRGFERSKVWICLFTCCVVRAIHLEIVSELTAQAFIRCFKRFTARKGLPHKVISDNAFSIAKIAFLANLNVLACQNI